jgi:hypothetical protein
MKFSFARGALALMATLTLASCGGGKATFPINVSVTGVSYDGLVLTTNGQELPIHYTGDPKTPATINAVFPNGIEYGEIYTVVPKTVTTTGSDGKAVTTVSYPQHQTCSPATGYPIGLPITGTAGQLSKIQINYACSINAYPLTGKVTGLRGTGLTLANGSGVATVSVSPALGTDNQPTGADITNLTLFSVTFATTYGVTVLTQPTGQTCTISGGANGTGAGTMDQAAETAGGVSNFVISCVNNPT